MTLFRFIAMLSLIQIPHILEKGKSGGKVHLCSLLYKIKDGRKPPECKVWLNRKRIGQDDEYCSIKYNIDRNTFEISILHFVRKLKGVYECVASTVEEPTVSTAVEVTIEPGM